MIELVDEQSRDSAGWELIRIPGLLLCTVADMLTGSRSQNHPLRAIEKRTSSF